MTQRRKVLIVAILSTSSLLVLVGLLEVGARVFGFRGVPKLHSTQPRIPHSTRGWAFKPNLAFSFLGTEGWVEGSTDAEGFRPVRSGRDLRDSPIVVCLGDSTTFSGESPDDRTWPEAASRALAEQGIAVRMLNRGIRGYNTVQSLLTLQETLKDEKVGRLVRAVVYHFCGNDPSENLAPGRPHLAAASPEGSFPARPLRVVIPPASDALPSERRWTGKFYDRSAFAAAIRRAKLDVSRAAFQKGCTEYMDMFTGWYQDFVARPALQQSMKVALAELARECTARNVPLFVSFSIVPAWDGDKRCRRDLLDLSGESPEKFQTRASSYVVAFDWLRETTEEVGATFVDLRNCLAALSHREYVAAPDDWHFGPAANEKLGRAIAEHLRVRLQGKPR